MGSKALNYLLGRSIGYPLNAFIVPNKDLPIHKILSNTDIGNIVSSVIGIINAAYDGETYTLWLENDDVLRQLESALHKK